MSGDASITATVPWFPHLMNALLDWVVRRPGQGLRLCLMFFETFLSVIHSLVGYLILLGSPRSGVATKGRPVLGLQ